MQKKHRLSVPLPTLRPPGTVAGDFRSAQPEVLYGIHPVTEALAAGRRRVFQVFIAPGKKAAWEAFLRLQAAKREVPLTETSLPEVNRMAKSRFTQGVAALVSPYPVLEAARFLGKEDFDGDPTFLLVADGVTDTGNLGALIRTGLCAGITAIVVPKDRCAPPTPAVSRASAGALEHVRMVRVPNLVSVLKRLKEKGVWVYGLDAAAQTSLFAVDLSGPVALVVGGEEKGIRPLVKRHCDALISIPQKGKLNSLNVSVAGGIALYAVFRQRLKGGAA